MKTPELEKEFELLKRANAHLGSEKPLREMAMTPEDKKRLRGFMFLSEKPIFYVLNIGESTELGKELDEAVSKYNLTRERRASQRRGHSHLRQSGSRTRRDERRRCRGISLQLRTQGKRPGAPHSHDLQAAGPDFIFHRRRRRMPRLADSRQLARTGSAPAPSTPIWKNISSAPKPSAGTNCSKPARKPTPAPKVRCAWKARTTSCRTAT